MFKSAIRVNKIKTVAQLRGATHHAERHDEVGRARVREGAELGEALAWSKADNPRDYLAAFKAHKAEMGAGERKNAPLAMQALCVVSPEWVQKAGDLARSQQPQQHRPVRAGQGMGRELGGQRLGLRGAPRSGRERRGRGGSDDCPCTREPGQSGHLHPEGRIGRLLRRTTLTRNF